MFLFFVFKKGREDRQRSEEHNREEKVDLSSFVVIENLHYSVTEAELLVRFALFKKKKKKFHSYCAVFFLHYFQE